MKRKTHLTCIRDKRNSSRQNIPRHCFEPTPHEDVNCVSSSSEKEALAINNEQCLPFKSGLAFNESL